MQVASRNSPWAARGRGKRNPKIPKNPENPQKCKFEKSVVPTTMGTTVDTTTLPYLEGLSPSTELENIIGLLRENATLRVSPGIEDCRTKLSLFLHTRT